MCFWRKKALKVNEGMPDVKAFQRSKDQKDKHHNGMYLFYRNLFKERYDFMITIILFEMNENIVVV